MMVVSLETRLRCRRTDRIVWPGRLDCHYGLMGSVQLVIDTLIVVL